MDIHILTMKVSDLTQVREIDIATQVQYLGEDFSRLSDPEKDKRLVTTEYDFELYISTGFCFVATSRTMTVGFVLAYFNSPFKDEVFIRHIATFPNLQANGVGRALFQAVINAAKLAGVKRITSHINFDNENSKKLHEALGFKVISQYTTVLEVK